MTTLISEPCHCIEDQAPTATWGSARGMLHGTVAYTRGMEPEPRPLLPGYDDGVAAILTGVFLLLALSVSRHTTFLRTFASALLSGPRRTDTFDDHTVAESRITASLLILCCLCEGIMIHSALPFIGSWGSPAIAISICAAGAAALMLCQSAAYALTGYAFAYRAGDTRMWLRGFFASQSLLAIALTLPALALLFYPGAAREALTVGAILYVIARLFFFAKGFRFFYTNIFSLFFFILYLCTLEIAPILALGRIDSL
ncbi:MAG: DUF4271 domain-containing protein [Pseudoflavonifractor sp.]|nr:DUF4271 domain-containing protein [Alloprevotella sp.]MCM1116918.1 DUF4271 domain-containing protein [Pseudoflavonifractor sp.]